MANLVARSARTVSPIHALEAPLAALPRARNGRRLVAGHQPVEGLPVRVARRRDHRHAGRARRGERVARVDVLAARPDVVVPARPPLGVRDGAGVVAAGGQGAAAHGRVDDRLAARAEERLVRRVGALEARRVAVARGVALVVSAAEELLANARAEVVVAN